MSIQKTTVWTLGGLCLATLVLALIPIVQTVDAGGYRGVPPAFVDDDLYYYGRIHEVIDGKPFLGNPQFIEHRDATPAAFFIGEWLAAVPVLLGVPFVPAMVVNFVAWSLVFVLLVYCIGRTANEPSWYAAGAALVAYAEVYWLILRPVPMQQVFPFFLIFMLALVTWHKQPSTRRSYWFLVAAGAASFYAYTYSWEIMVATLGTVGVAMLIQKRWARVKALLAVAGGIVVFALPMLAYTVYQMRAPFYWETFSRIGLVLSHLPTIYVYQYGRWVIVLVVLALAIRRWFSGAADDQDPWVSATLYSGIGMLGLSLSNILTGKDVATAQHVGRFITLWIALLLPVFLWRLWEYRATVRRAHWLKRATIVVLVLAGIGFLAGNLKRALPFWHVTSASITAVQTYAAPLAWLEQHEKNPVVVWADDAVSAYVPILTKHYVFWSPMGGLYLVPTDEVRERFLAAHMGVLNADELISSYQQFEGIGSYARYNDATTKMHVACFFTRTCESLPTFRQWIGENALQELLVQQKELQKNIGTIMNHYHVAYVVADVSKAEEKYFAKLPGVAPVWKNERFIIYHVR